MGKYFIDILVITCIIIVCLLAYRKKSLTALGALVAFSLTVVLYISGGITFLAALFGFFVSSSFFTRLKTSEKEDIEKFLYEKGGTRDHIQVLANGGSALIIAVIHYLAPAPELTVIFFAALAACNADSWASEVGVFSRTEPFSIISFEPVQKGMSGGVSYLGFFASICGAVFIAGIYFVFMLVRIPFLELIRNCTIIAFFGFIGALLDSVMGALIQPAYIDSATGKLTEKRMSAGIKNKKAKGIEFFSNDMVNFVSSLMAASLTFTAFLLFFQK